MSPRLLPPNREKIRRKKWHRATKGGVRLDARTPPEYVRCGVWVAQIDSLLNVGAAAFGLAQVDFRQAPVQIGLCKVMTDPDGV